MVNDSGTNFITDYCSWSPWNATTTHSYISLLLHLSLGLLFSLGPLLLLFLVQTLQCLSFSVSVSKHITPQTSFYICVNVIEEKNPATKPDWNQLWLAQFTQHKSAVCKLFKCLFIISQDILFMNWYHCRNRGFYTVSKVWSIVFAIVGWCVLTFVNTTKIIHNFVGRYSLSVKKI